MAAEMPPDPVPYRLLPSVEELLRALDEPGSCLGPGEAQGLPREVCVEHVRGALEDWRARIRAGGLSEAELSQALLRGELLGEVRARLAREARAGLASAVNATGVVLHTGLGRAPLHPEAAEAMRAAASGYCVLEVDRESGERGERDARIGELCARLSGAEAAIAVNNNAAATYLVLSTFAWGGREVIVSRGELVEIGGSFRMPEVMQRAGVALREVGTTNRTRLEDYRAAIGERTGLLLKVHTSNFRLQGFTAEVSAADLASLARERALPCAYDLGSGLVDQPFGSPLSMLAEEPRVRAAVESGVDLVTFSGDKLLGGPQAGLIVGRREAVAAARKNPVYRALRLDKVTIAGLERTLELYLHGRADELPAHRMLLLGERELEPRAAALAAALRTVPDVSAEVVAATSQPGSGSAPGVFLPTRAVRVRHARLSTSALAGALRRGEPPVFARIHEDALLLDPRTLLEGDEQRVLAAFHGLRSSSGSAP